MLTRLSLKHFKCFSLLDLPLRPLTLLAGGNASGKSTIIQALTLLHQAVREGGLGPTLLLNGPVIKLGKVRDVVDRDNSRTSCEIGLQFDPKDDADWMEIEGCRLKFEGNRTDGYMKISEIIEEWPEKGHKEESLEQKVLKSVGGMWRLAWLTYLTAERLGPREIYDIEEFHEIHEIDRKYELLNIGPKGEYTVSALHTQRGHEVLDGLIIENTDSNTLWNQVKKRMEVFFPGFEMQIQAVDRVNAVRLGLDTSKETDFLTPPHTGFGLTQVLPVVVGALSAESESLFLIENPEVHLHPAAQALMGEFLAEVAAAGVQVILETHSDHILNGIRRAVKKGQLPAQDAALYFFRPRQGEGEDSASQVQHIIIDSNGNLDDWPEGFFDQFDKDLNYFAWC